MTCSHHRAKREFFCEIPTIQCSRGCLSKISDALKQIRFYRNNQRVLTLEKQQVDDFSSDDDPLLGWTVDNDLWCDLGTFPWSIPLCLWRPPRAKIDMRREWRTTPSVEIQLGIFITAWSQNHHDFNWNFLKIFFDGWSALCSYKNYKQNSFGFF